MLSGAHSGARPAHGEARGGGGRRLLLHRRPSSFLAPLFIVIPFLFASSFPRPLLLLLGCCSDDVFAVSPSLPSLCAPLPRARRLSLAMNQTAFRARYVTKRGRGRGDAFYFYVFYFSFFSVFLPFPPLLTVCVSVCMCVSVLFRPSVEALARDWCAGLYTTAVRGCAMCRSDPNGRPHASPFR